MRFPSLSRSLSGPSCLCLLALFCLTLPSFVSAQSLKITSNPPGATVELDGVLDSLHFLCNGLWSFDHHFRFRLIGNFRRCKPAG